MHPYLYIHEKEDEDVPLPVETNFEEEIDISVQAMPPPPQKHATGTRGRKITLASTSATLPSNSDLVVGASTPGSSRVPPQPPTSSRGIVAPLSRKTGRGNQLFLSFIIILCSIQMPHDDSSNEIHLFLSFDVILYHPIKKIFQNFQFVLICDHDVPLVILWILSISCIFIFMQECVYLMLLQLQILKIRKKIVFFIFFEVL